MKLLFTILTLLMSLLGYGQITSRNANEVIPRSIRSLGDRIPQVDVLPSVPNLLQYTGDAASGAFVYCRCTADTSKRGVYYWEVNQWVRLTSGDVSFLITDFDSTGQLRGRLLFSGRNYKVVSSPRLLVDSINSKVVINNSNVSVGGPQTKLFVGGNVVSTDTVKGYALQVNGITELEDTTTSKPMIIDEDGNTFRLKYWSMVGIGGGGLTYPNTANKYLNGYGNFVTLNSDSLTEGSTNQFFTNTRARAAISLTTTGTSGAATYNSSTGVLNIPNYAGGGGGVTTMAAIGSIPNANGATISGSTLNLQPANESFGGVLTTGTQNIAGVKYFRDIVYINSGATNYGNIRGGGSFFEVESASGRTLELNRSNTSAVVIRGGNSFNSTSNTLTSTGFTGSVGISAGATLSLDFAANSAGRFRIQSNGQTHLQDIVAAAPTMAAGTLFQLESTTRGFLPPRMTTTQMNAISTPVAGLMIYNTTENAVMTYDGTRWVGFRYNGTVYQGYNSTANAWTDLN